MKSETKLETKYLSDLVSYLRFLTITERSASQTLQESWEQFNYVQGRGKAPIQSPASQCCKEERFSLTYGDEEISKTKKKLI